MAECKMTMKQHFEIMVFFVAVFLFAGFMTYSTQPTQLDKKNKEIVELAQDATKRLNAGDTVCVTHQEFKGCITDGVLTVTALTGSDEIWLYKFEQVPIGVDTIRNHKLDYETLWSIREKMEDAAKQFAISLRGIGALTPNELREHRNNQIKKIVG